MIQAKDLILKNVFVIHFLELIFQLHKKVKI